MVILPSWDPEQLGMTKWCCACHSSTIAALIYIIIASDMHRQKVEIATYRLPHVNLHAIEQRQPLICQQVPTDRQSCS
jgi:hypothetical protein